MRIPAVEEGLVVGAELEYTVVVDVEVELEKKEVGVEEVVLKVKPEIKNLGVLWVNHEKKEAVAVKL